MKKQKVSTGDEMFLVRVQEMQLEWAALVYFIKSPGSAKESAVRTVVRVPAQNKLPYHYLHIDQGLESLLRNVRGGLGASERGVGHIDSKRLDRPTETDTRDFQMNQST